MKIFKFKSVKTKIILPVLIIVIVMFSISSYLKIGEFRKTSEENLENQVSRVMFFSSLSCKCSNYNYDQATIDEISGGVLDVREIGYIKLFDTSQITGVESKKEGPQYADDELKVI